MLVFRIFCIFQWDTGGDVRIEGKHVVTAGGLTLEFREDFLGYPHGAHAFFPEWALEIIMGPMLFLPLESPKEILWEALALKILMGPMGFLLVESPKEILWEAMGASQGREGWLGWSHGREG